MPSGFLKRNIEVFVDARTWAGGVLPSALKKASRTTPIDVADALHMLGALTIAGRFRHVTIRQGVNKDLIDELSTAGALAEESLDAELLSFGPEDRIILASKGSRLVLRYGRVSFSEVIWEKRKGSR